MTATHHDALVERLDAQVRELVRRDGVDPQRDALVVRRIAETVVRDHDERSLTGQVAPVADPTGVVGELVARVSGFGPLQPFLDDPTVEEVWINELAEPFDLSLPAISKHIKLLERAGLVVRGRRAQYRPCVLDGARIAEVSTWAERYRPVWEARVDRLEDYLTQLGTHDRTGEDDDSS
jgi:DNA-binding transcriptional ArsR family regulator